MSRTYECRNTDCSNYRVPLHVQARPLGTYWEYPNVVCDCGAAVSIVAVDGRAILRDEFGEPGGAA